ncbi:MAG TPA: hypothetical protein VGG29_14510 [Caulobacteraceae bacterium]|jgi:hypothetical protein
MSFSARRVRRAASAATVLLVAALLAAALALAPALAAAQIAPDAGTPGQAAYDLRQLVAKYVAWRGPAFDELQTVHERLYVDTQAGRRSGALWMDRQGRLRREIDGDDARLLEVAGPDGAWRLGADGRLEDDPAGVERARRYAALQFGDALRGRDGARAALAGTADLEDRTWTVIRVSFGDADVYDALVDPATGGLCCYRITEGGAQRTELFGDWRLVDGVRMPFTRLVRAGYDMGFRAAAVELNRDLDPALFAKPAEK